MWGGAGNREMTPSRQAGTFLRVIISNNNNPGHCGPVSSGNIISPLAPNIITDGLKTLQNLMEENLLIDLVLIHTSAILCSCQYHVTQYDTLILQHFTFSALNIFHHKIELKFQPQ